MKVMNSRLNQMIAGGEGQHLDFKFEISDSRKIARTLSAFSNSEGGTLLVGVKDNGKIAGVRSDEEYYMLEAAAQLYCKPEVNFSVRQWHAEGKTILEVKIDKSGTPPHFAQSENGKWLAYIRVRDENILANSIMIRVWKRMGRPVGTHIRYTDKERILFDYLRRNDIITLSMFQRIARTNMNTAGNILVNLIVLNIITIRIHNKMIVYTLAEKDA